jgi:hypothetical protein
MKINSSISAKDKIYSYLPSINLDCRLNILQGGNIIYCEGKRVNTNLDENIYRPTIKALQI